MSLYYEKAINNYRAGGKMITISCLLVVFDFISICAAYGLALAARFDFKVSGVPGEFTWVWLRTIPVYALIVIGLFFIFKLYNSIWRFVSYAEMSRVLTVTVLSTLLYCLVVNIFLIRMPLSYYLFGGVLQGVFTGGIRISYRALRRISHLIESLDRNNTLKKTLVIGAGEAGRSIARQIMVENPRSHVVCCFVDDNPNKKGRTIEGINVEGNRHSIPELVSKYGIEEILLAIPTIDRDNKEEILEICKGLGCRLRTLPGMTQLINNRVSMEQIRDVSVEELLKRDQVLVYDDEIDSMLAGRRALVTGGGGSIGSELVRQIAEYGPEQIVIFDSYENNAYEIQQEIRMNKPEVNLKVCIGSVRDRVRIESVMKEYSPDVVFHAAAVKHVPLMEDSPWEAVKTNAAGTLNVARAAGSCRVRKMVLISTDKAVNPTNIMGASKRLCEMIIQSISGEYPETIFSAVRFGNVLGSNGSVIPLFKRQIAAGGPVTVTHPEITRFFMTIPEAVHLVLKAGVKAGSGEIYVLNMGEPVKILELAEDLIYLSGNTPGKDIEIKFTGLRPGEKLYEEVLLDEEGITETGMDKIFIGRPLKIRDDFLEEVEKLTTEAYSCPADMKKKVAELVDTYKPEGNNGKQQ
ncbi:MAG: polysaccharide biosynthesis protein [Lentihominibacter sp.]